MLNFKNRELAEQRDWLKTKLAEMVSQRDEMMVQRDEMLAQRDEMIAQRDEMAAQRNEAVTKVDVLAGQRDNLISQVADLSSAKLRNNALSRYISELAGDAGANTERLQSLLGNRENLRAAYLGLMEQVLIGAIYDDPPLGVHGQDKFDVNVRRRGLDWPKMSFSMIGAARMRNFRVLVEKVVVEGVPGDIVETGVWRGGACIMARSVLAAYGVKDRRVILADSFEGLPAPDPQTYPADEGSTFHQFPELAVSIEDVRRNFSKFGFLDDQVLMLKGWFKDTIPAMPSDRIAVLRLDGDMYESTIVPLAALFDKVSKDGWIIVDDYEHVPACKVAVSDFLSGRGLEPEIRQIDGVGVFFQKT